jgi:hypothetical protein
MSLNKKRPRLQPNKKGTKITKRSTGIVNKKGTKDGRVLNKDGTILDVNAGLTDNVDQQKYGFPTRSAKKRIQDKKANNSTPAMHEFIKPSQNKPSSQSN